MITTLEITMLTFMKKLSKEQIEKRKKIKDYLLKSLHIVCYILSALFIIVCVAVNVQSCSGKNKSSNKVNRDLDNLSLRYTDIDFDYSYTSIYSGTNAVIDLDKQDLLLKSYNQWLSVYSTYGEVINSTFDFELDGLYVLSAESNEFMLLNHAYVTFSTYLRSGSDYRFRLTSIYFQTIDGTQFGLLNKNVQGQDGTAFNDLTYNVDSWWYKGYYNKIYCSYELVNYSLFNLFFYVNNLSSFTTNIIFPNKLNYYYWISDASYSRTIDSDYAHTLDIAKSNSFSDSEASYYLFLDMPYFVSNGKLYNRIALNYLCLGYGDSPSYFQNRGTEAGYDSLLNSELSNFGLFLGMGYINTDHYSSVADIDVALLRNNIYLPKYPYSGGQVVKVFTNEFSWQISAYQKIKILQEFPNNNSQTSFELLISQSINNAQVNVYSSLFSLLGYAFASLRSIFDIQVMPMLSIGVLLFTPLLIGLIVIIFRMVKK